MICIQTSERTKCYDCLNNFYHENSDVDTKLVYDVDFNDNNKKIDI